MLFDPLTGHASQRVRRFTVYPSSHYVTPGDYPARRSKRSRSSSPGGSSIPERRAKLLEAQRIEQRTRFDLEMLVELGFLQGSRIFAAPVRKEGGRAAAHADRYCRRMR